MIFNKPSFYKRNKLQTKIMELIAEMYSEHDLVWMLDHKLGGDFPKGSKHRYVMRRRDSNIVRLFDVTEREDGIDIYNNPT